MRNGAGLLRLGSVLAAVAAVCVGAVRAPGSVQLAESRARAGVPASSTVLVDSSTLVCPGPQRIGLKGLRDVKGTTQVSAVAPPTAVLAAAAATPPAATLTGSVSLSVGAAKPPAVVRERAATATASATAAQPLLATGTLALAPGLAATQVWERRGDDDRGLAVTPCTLPSSDVWLIGGGGGPSRSERLIVGNPGGNAVSVRFQVFGASGPVASAQGRDVAIPARARAVVSLDAIAPDEPRPGVHVVATGGVVSAVLDDAWIDGATGRGLDDATRSAPPSRDQVIAGLDGSGAATVRLLNPGESEALVQVRVLTPTGATQPAALRAVRVPPGSTTDVALDLPAGPAGLHLIADTPVVAGASVERRVASGADRMGDFGWAPATRPIAGLAGLVLPPQVRAGSSASLLLAGGGRGGRVVVHLVTAGVVTSAPTTVAADSVAGVGLGDADQVWVTQTSGDVRAAVSVSGVVGGVPRLSIAALTSAPLTALSVPVRQVAN